MKPKVFNSEDSGIFTRFSSDVTARLIKDAERYKKPKAAVVRVLVDEAYASRDAGIKPARPEKW